MYFKDSYRSRLWLKLLVLIGIITLASTGCSQSTTQNSEAVSSAWRDPEPGEVGPSVPTSSAKLGSSAAVGGSANAKIFEQAQSALNESSRNGPDGGNLACAWMVNKILQRAVGFTVNGDSTSSMHTEFQRLVASGRAEQIPIASVQPGDVIISPTV